MDMLKVSVFFEDEENSIDFAVYGDNRDLLRLEARLHYIKKLEEQLAEEGEAHATSMNECHKQLKNSEDDLQTIIDHNIELQQQLTEALKRELDSEKRLLSLATELAKMTIDKYPFVHLRMDVSEAEKEGSLKDKLIELGWVEPGKVAEIRAREEDIQKFYLSQKKSWEI